MYSIYQKLLDKKGLKNADVARATGISNMTLSDWKNGKSTPKQDKLTKIADFLGVTVDFLMGKADMVVCPVCGFEDNPLSEQSRKVHELFHKQFLSIKKEFPQYMPYHQADKLRSRSIRILRDVNISNEEKLDAFKQYLDSSFSLELSRMDYDKLDYVDYDKFCMHEVGNAFACGYFTTEFKDMLVDKYGVTFDYASINNSDEMIIERARNNSQLMRILAYAEKLNAGMLDTIEIQLKALAEQQQKQDDVISMNDYVYNKNVNAAHSRTYIDVPEGTDTSDNDIMDDDNF